MIYRDKQTLLRLHRTVLEGYEAIAVRDAFLLELHEEGVTQTELAATIDSKFPGTMSRNSMQKLLTRERARNGNGS